MIRRIISILFILMSIPTTIALIILVLTVPVWTLVLLVTGWWIYPPANALMQNVFGWLMVRSATKDFINKEYYNKEDYKRLRKSLRTQKF